MEEIEKATRKLAKADPRLAMLINRHGPCALGAGKGQYFDILVSSIISQQLSSKAAGSIKERVVGVIGRSRPFEHRDFQHLHASELRNCGLSTSKASYIKNLAANVSSRKLAFEQLDKLNEEEVITILCQFRGIGRWTAEMFLIFGLGRPDVLAANDAGLLRAASILYDYKCSLSPKHFTRLAEKWRPYRSIASWYLWRSLD